LTAKTLKTFICETGYGTIKAVDVFSKEKKYFRKISKLILTHVFDEGVKHITRMKIFVDAVHIICYVFKILFSNNTNIFIVSHSL
jgi:hypothetical protein